MSEHERVLVTGAQGFVGRYLVRALLDGHPSVSVLGIGRSPRTDASFTHEVTGPAGPVPAPVPAQCRLTSAQTRYRYARVDILDRAAIVDLVGSFRPDLVVHLASGLRDDPVRDLVRINVEGTAALIEALVESAAGKPRLLYGSSGGVYGVPATVPIAETATCEPIDAYSVTKLAAEHCARVLAKRHGLDLVVGRIFNVVGPGQEERHVCGHLARQLDAIRRRRARPAVRMGATDTTRDFVDVRDVARALVVLGRSGTSDHAYNIGSGVETPVRTLLPRMIELCGAGVAIRVEPVEGRPADIPRHVADIRRMRKLGFCPGVDLEQSLRDTLEYYRDLPEEAR